MWGFFIHSNIRVRLGPLEWLLSTPAFHHWHHTRHDHVDRNFAAMLPVLDRIFGTHHLPRSWPSEYGSDTPVASQLGGQLTAPFKTAMAAGTVDRTES
jgi:sterol desaturase/sphingolipid hydroxylase (fatty acid hydroxylase superfamily)